MAFALLDLDEKSKRKKKAKILHTEVDAST